MRFGASYAAEPGGASRVRSNAIRAFGPDEKTGMVLPEKPPEPTEREAMADTAAKTTKPRKSTAKSTTADAAARPPR